MKVNFTPWQAANRQGSLRVFMDLVSDFSGQKAGLDGCLTRGSSLDSETMLLIDE